MRKWERMSPLLATALLAAALPNAVVLRPVANMYSRASLDADVVSQAIYGANVAIIGEQPGWANIRTPDDYTGWVPLPDLLRTPTPYAAGRAARVDSLFAHLYREPNVTRHAPLLTVPYETRLEIASESKDNPRWLQVRLADDRSAWLQAGDIVFDTAPLSVSATIAVAKRFLGVPYTWGGTSSYGYDCSGFMQMLGRRRGVNMPRDAAPQAHWNGVVPVDRTTLEPGDLLYFGASPAKITHTAMYLGEGKFINATTHEHPVVRIDNLDDPHWTRLLVACRRLK